MHTSLFEDAPLENPENPENPENQENQENQEGAFVGG